MGTPIAAPIRKAARIHSQFWWCVSRVPPIAIAIPASPANTRRMTSRPTKVASMKTIKPISRLEGMYCLDSSGQAQRFTNARVDHFSGVRDQRFTHDFVFAIDGELALFDQVLEEGRDVLGVH